ncbi:hypothetical protein LINGRAHAP2_LOCUS27749 [Linum grandiflorum]
MSTQLFALGAIWTDASKRISVGESISLAISLCEFNSWMSTARPRPRFYVRNSCASSASEVPVGLSQLETAPKHHPGARKQLFTE